MKNSVFLTLHTKQTIYGPSLALYFVLVCDDHYPLLYANKYVDENCGSINFIR